MTEKSAMAWPCPVCKSGQLKLIPESLGYFETRDSINTRQSFEEGEWEPGIPFYRFSCTLRCYHAYCAEPVIVSGHTTDEQEMNAESGFGWERYLVPVFFHPPPPIIAIPEKCPPALKKEIKAAFALYWCDKRSCANRLRTAIELLLTHLKVTATRHDLNQHKRIRLSLHGRIKLFEQKDKELATAMFAVKWLGNEGSHPGLLQQEDLLDAFEITHHLLRSLFVPPDKNRVIEIAKQIHRRKKPRSQQRANKRTQPPKN